MRQIAIWHERCAAADVYNASMPSLLRPLSLCVSTLFLTTSILTACGLSANAFDGEGEGEGASEEVADGGCDGCSPDAESSTCDDLVDVTCGGGAECSEDPGCVAATLLQTYQPEGCAAALTDVRSYPRCAASNCDELVVRVCGVDDRCTSSSACAPARELQGRAEAGDTNATASCAAALTDQTLFPQCP